MFTVINQLIEKAGGASHRCLFSLECVYDLAFARKRRDIIRQVFAFFASLRVFGYKIDFVLTPEARYSP